MDKYEYKVHADEIRRLVAEGDFAAAVEICDIIDWNRVKSVTMLCTVSDIYKINKRFEDSKNILLLAYDRHPGGRQIVYSLCELSIKLEEYVQAIEYYKEFVRIAPRDTGKFILLYRLYEAQDAGLEDRIDVLKKFKAREYKEKWAYELAYLYHRNGNITDCIEECDELVLWFGDGKYVKKALELKMLHAPLTPQQQAKYDLLMGRAPGAGKPAQDGGSARVPEQPADVSPRPDASRRPVPDAPTVEIPGKEIDIHVKTMDVGQYSTINLQKALAESMREALNAETVLPEQEKTAPRRFTTEDLRLFPAQEETAPAQAAGAEEAFDQTDPDLARMDAIDLDTEDFLGRQTPPEAEQVFFEDGTGALPPMAQMPSEEERGPKLSNAELVMQQMKQDWVEGKTHDAQAAQEAAAPARDGAAYAGPRVVMPERSRFDHILSQEYDGQISLVVPEATGTVKQITGQMSITDIMTEWEKMKKQNEQKRAEDVRRHVLEQTGNMFKDFEISSRNGLFEQLEANADAADMPSDTEAAGTGETAEADDGEAFAEEEAAAPQACPAEVSPASAEETSAGPQEGGETRTEPEIHGETEPQAGEADKETASDAESPAQPEGEAQTGEGEETRSLTEEEKNLFGRFIQNRKSRRQIVHALDTMSLAAYTGNVIVTGDEGTGTMALAKNLIREIQLTDRNFSGKVAKINASALNKKDVAGTLAKLSNGALIIQGAGGLEKSIVQALCRTLDNENSGIIVVLEGTRRSVDRMLDENGGLSECFNARVDVEALPNDELVSFGKKYARQMEYSIDDMGTLALHTRISDMQTADHAVTIYEVRDIIDEAIEEADRKNPKHFFDILLGKRYDEDDMIILREDDFMKNIG